MRYVDHKDRWDNCQGCLLSKGRGRVVLARGKIPCDILIIGEAPGASEDVLGQPFVGPAGQLLDTLLTQAYGGVSTRYRIAFTNLVACIPLGEDGNKTAEPPKEAIEACRERLREFITELARPKRVVLAGKLSEKWGPKALPEGIPTLSIYHPAALIRMSADQKPLAIQKTIIDLREFPEYA